MHHQRFLLCSPFFCMVGFHFRVQMLFPPWLSALFSFVRQPIGGQGVVPPPVLNVALIFIHAVHSKGTAICTQQIGWFCMGVWKKFWMSWQFIFFYDHPICSAFFICTVLCFLALARSCLWETISASFHCLNGTESKWNKNSCHAGCSQKKKRTAQGEKVCISGFFKSQLVITMVTRGMLFPACRWWVGVRCCRRVGSEWGILGAELALPTPGVIYLRERVSMPSYFRATLGGVELSHERNNHPPGMCEMCLNTREMETQML